MFESNLVGRTTTLTTAEVTVVFATGNFALIGVSNNASVTGNTTLQIRHAVTSTASASGTNITGIITWVSATATGLYGTNINPKFMSIPAYCSGGIGTTVGGDASPSITLYWNPV